jgi:hypothetical protein
LQRCCILCYTDGKEDTDMPDEEAAQRSEAARAMGRARTPRKVETARENVGVARQKRWEDPDARKRFGDAVREGHRKRREAKERAVSAVGGTDGVPGAAGDVLG